MMTITFFDANAHTPDKHPIDKMIHFITDIQQLTNSELEQLVEHIIDCQDCRDSIRVFIAAGKDMARTENCPGTRTGGLLDQMAQIMLEIDAKNDISAYIDVLEMQGKEAAESQFPLLADH